MSNCCGVRSYLLTPANKGYYGMIAGICEAAVCLPSRVYLKPAQAIRNKK